MGVTNNLKPQVDTPVWEWCRQAPAVSSSLSSACAAKNSLYHVTYGRYIYYFQSNAITTGNVFTTGFFRYDTISDSYQELAVPPFTTGTFSAMDFAGDQGFFGYVLGNGGGQNTLQSAALTGQTLKGFDIRIIGGTGYGQTRTITGVSDPVLHDCGTVTAVAATPQNTITDVGKTWAWNQWVGYQIRFVSSNGQSQLRKILYNTANTITFADVNKFAEEDWAYSPVVTVANSPLVIAVAASTVYHIESSIITVDSNWLVKPDSTSRFVVKGGGIYLLSLGTNYILQYYDILGDQWYLRNGGAATSPWVTASTDASIVSTGENATVWERGKGVGTQSSTTFQDTTKSWTTNQWAGYYIRIWSGTGEDQYRKITSNTNNTLTVPAWDTITPDSTSKYFIEGLENGTASSALASNSTGVSTGTIVGNVFTAGTTTGKYYVGQVLTGTGVLANTTVLSPLGACNTNGAVNTIYFAWGNPVTMGIVNNMIVSLATINAGTGALAAATTGPTYVTGVFAPAGSTPGYITVSNNVATQLVNATLQFVLGWCSGTAPAAHTVAGTTITLSGGNGTAGLYPGMVLTVGTGTGTFLAGTYVAQVIDSTKFTISVAMSAGLSGSTWITAVAMSQTVITGQLSGVPSEAGTYTVFPSQQVASTTITGSGVATLMDSSKDWQWGRWNGCAVRIKSGTGKGQVRSILSVVSSGSVTATMTAGSSNGTTITVASTSGLAVNNLINVTAGTGSFPFGTFVSIIIDSTHFIASTAPTIALSGATVTSYCAGTLIISPNWSVVPDSTSTYVIHGDNDKTYFHASGNTPTYVQNYDADITTTGRQLDKGVARGVGVRIAPQQEEVAISTATLPISVLNVTGGIGYIAGIATTAGSVAGAGTAASPYIATITYAPTTAISVFPVGSWIKVAGTTPAGYVGNWQVLSSSPGSVSFFIGASLAAISTQGTVGQANSFNLELGSTIDSGTWTQFGDATTLVAYGFYPTAWTATYTVAAGLGSAATASFGGYQSSALVASSSSNTITLSSGTNVGLVIGQQPTVIAGTGTFAPGTIVTSLISTNQFTVNINPSVGLSGATVAVYPSFATTATAAVGSPTTLGILQKTPQAPTAFTVAGGVATVTTSKTIFPVGSYVVIAGVTPGVLNGTYQVTGGTPGTNFTFATATAFNGISVTGFGTVGLTTYNQMLTTVNNHKFQTGQTLTVSGDQGATATANNTSGILDLIVPQAPATAATQLVYTTSATGGPLIVGTQSTTLLYDGTKNWVPNQWAGCTVTYNSNQITAAVAPVQPTLLSAHIIANTPQALIFAAAHTTAPLAGVSRYVITTPFTAPGGNMLGSLVQGLNIGNQAANTNIQDVTQAWIMPAATAGITATTITVGGATAVITGSMNNITLGMLAVITVGTVSLPANTTIAGISGTTVTFSNSFGGSGTTATFTFVPAATSSGTTVTVYGYPMCGLYVGMKLAVTSTGTNWSSQVLSTGSLLQNAGTGFTLVTVSTINSYNPTTGIGSFTLSQAPAVPLLNATLNATNWVPNQWANRRVRIMSGVTINNAEQVITANTYNTLTLTATIGAVPVSGTNGYSILKQPVVRGVGTGLFWNCGVSDANMRGRCLYQARGGGLPGFDRLDFLTDDWKFLTATPGFEAITTGTMYAYDGGDRLYFTLNVSQRVYYLDLDNNAVHPAGLYPYTAGAAILGNRMEIYTTPDRLKYLWLNRHSNVECFKQLLFY